MLFVCPVSDGCGVCAGDDVEGDVAGTMEPEGWACGHSTIRPSIH